MHFHYCSSLLLEGLSLAILASHVLHSFVPTISIYQELHVNSIEAALFHTAFNWTNTTELPLYDIVGSELKGLRHIYLENWRLIDGLRSGELKARFNLKMTGIDTLNTGPYLSLDHAPFFNRISVGCRRITLFNN